MAIEPTRLPEKSQEAVKNLKAGRDITFGDVHQEIIINEGQKAQLIYSDPLPDLRHFQGRKDKLAELYGWLKDYAVSLIGVRGEGGIGKSTLTAKAFASCAGFQGKFLADVRTNTAITSLAGRALKELGVPLAQVQAIEDKDLPQRLLRHLQTGRYLLVIDNMESLLSPEGEWQSGYGEFLSGFQAAGSNSVLLLASREYPQRYFGWLRSQWLVVEKGLSPEEGAALLRGLEVEGSHDELATVSADVRGNPLALALVAGWIRQAFKPGMRSVIRLAESTDLFQITGQHRGESDLSVNSVLGWSIDRLTDVQRHLLGQVSIFRGAFTVEAAQAVVPEQSDVADVLSELERRSLVQELAVQSNDDTIAQYRLQPRVKNYATRIVSNITAAHELAIDYFQRHAKTEFSLTASPEAFFEHFEIFHHLIQLERYKDAAVLVTSLDKFLRRRGFLQLLVDMYEQLYLSWHYTANLKNKDYAAICNNLGTAHDALSNYSQAIDYHQQSLVIKRKIGDQQGIANSLGNLGTAYKSLGQYEQAIDYQQQSLVIKREIGDQQGIANSLGNLGIAYVSLGQYEQAIDYQQQSLVIRREIGDQQGIANSLGDLGIAYKSLGQYERAISYHQQSLAIKREIGDQQGIATSLGNLGNAYGSLGQYEQSIDYQQQSLVIRRKIGDQQGIAASLGNLGNAYQSLGRYERAIDYQQQSLVIKRKIGDQQGIANSLGNLGIAYVSLGRYERAIDYQQQSLVIKRKIGDRRGEAISLVALGHLYQACGNPRAGFSASIAGTTICQELDLPLDVWPLPKWMKKLIHFASRGKFYLAICFLLGVVAFPFAAIWIIVLTLWRLAFGRFHR